MEQHTTKSISLMALSFMALSCINTNLLETDTESGEIPIKLSTQVQQNNAITDGDFSNGDSVGLYIIVPPATLSQSRYADNIKFTHSSSEGFTPKTTIYYPEGNPICEFIAYFPYRSQAVDQGKSTILIDVASNQTESNKFAASDFIVAHSNNVSPASEPVNLLFKHKLYRLNILINPGNNYTVENLLAANPDIIIKNVNTKATYDFSTDLFSGLNSKTDITPYGTWIMKDGMLCGKSAIVIPQTIASSSVIMELTVGDRTYSCKLGEELAFRSGRADDYTITIQSSGEVETLRATITHSIEGWEKGAIDIPANDATSAIQLSKLIFTDSQIYKVFSRGKQVAEICEEYLLSDKIAKQAIVVYPMKDQVVDLTRGLVAHIFDETGEKHGGTIVWNKANNTFAYTEGNSSAIDYIYLTEDEEIVTRRPEKSLLLECEADLLIDVRGTERITYPIVKIGTQYWQRGNLKTTKYTNGDAITQGGAQVSTTAQYHVYSGAYYFYNSAAIASAKLAPRGWRISNDRDWANIIAYINNDASILKNGDSWKNSLTPFTNLTKFNAVAVGMYNSTYQLRNERASYWATGNTSPEAVTKYYMLNNQNNVVTAVTGINNLALAIRFVRE